MIINERYVRVAMQTTRKVLLGMDSVRPCGGNAGSALEFTREWALVAKMHERGTRVGIVEKTRRLRREFDWLKKVNTWSNASWWNIPMARTYPLEVLLHAGPIP